MSDTAWARLARLIVPKHPHGGRPCPAERWREYLKRDPLRRSDGVSVVSAAARLQRLLIPLPQALSAWRRTGVWQRILPALREETRRRGGRHTKPTGAVINSSSVKGTPVKGPRGFVWLDGGYTGPTVKQAAARHGVTIEIVGGPKASSDGFKVQPRRWIVERTNGWINHNRRLVRQYSASTRQPSKLTTASSSSARPPHYSTSSTEANCSTRSREICPRTGHRPTRSAGCVRSGDLPRRLILDHL
jgi:transposase